jgi:hypothetical protein
MEHSYLMATYNNDFENGLNITERLKMKNIFKGLIGILLLLCLSACSEKPIKEYQAPIMPALLSPEHNSTAKVSMPALNWLAVESPSGGQTKYFVEILDTSNPLNSGWITETSWTPSSNLLGLYKWRVKAMDVNTKKESEWSNVRQFTLAAATDSTDLNLDIRIARFGPYDSQGNYADQSSNVRKLIVNNTVTIEATDAFFLPAGDPGPTLTKTLFVTYRNRWNEEWEVSCAEGQSIMLNRDSRVGTFILDADLQ